MRYFEKPCLTDFQTTEHRSFTTTLQMALIITDECINCDVCEPVCPNEAIYEGIEIYEIDPDRCTECVGHFEKPQCQQICPIDCIPLDPENQESKTELMEKFHRLT